MDTGEKVRMGLLVTLAVLSTFGMTGCGISALSQVPLAADAIPDGTYTVILYRGYGYRDLDSAAFLDPEGDGFSLAEDGSETGVIRILKQDRQHAYEAAEGFLSLHADFDHARIQALTTADGTLVGYEIRPIFFALDPSMGDPLEITYRADGTRFLFTVDYKWPPDEPDRRRR